MILALRQYYRLIGQSGGSERALDDAAKYAACATALRARLSQPMEAEHG